jgi:hypothetical protein
MPTVLLSPSFGAGFNLKESIKEEYLKRIGLKVPDDYTKEQTKCFIYYEFQKAMLKNKVAEYGNITSSDSNARADPIIIDIYNEYNDISLFNSGLVAVDLPDIFDNDWYITDYDGCESLNINIDRAFYRLSCSFIADEIGLEDYKNKWSEYNVIRDAFIDKIKSGGFDDMVVVNETKENHNNNEDTLKRIDSDYKESMIRANMKSVLNKNHIDSIINDFANKKINKRKIITDLMFNLFSAPNITRISDYDPSKQYCIWRINYNYILLSSQFIGIGHYEKNSKKAIYDIIDSFISLCRISADLDTFSVHINHMSANIIDNDDVSESGSDLDGW